MIAQLHSRILVTVLLAVWGAADLRAQTAADAPPTPADHLQPLEWLIGEWTGKADYGEVLVSSHWSHGGNFIVREFLVRGENGAEIGGTQWIGWDPIQGRIKSWTFDSQGGSGQGYWRRDGDRWIVESTEVTADGRQVTLSAVYTPVEDGKFAWENKGLPDDDQPLPAQRIEFSRAAEDQ